MNYKYKKGEYIQTIENFKLSDDLKQAIWIFIRIVCWFIVFIFTFIFSLMVFNHCIEVPMWNHTIPLGAVIATLGSAIVSIFTLFCNEQYAQFNENGKILQDKLIREKWDRWPFLKRRDRQKISKGVYEVKILKNPHIIFYNNENTWKITILLPTSKADFSELPIYSRFFKLMYNRQKLLLNNQNIEAALVWSCLTSIYKHIMLYRTSQILVWIGVCFIFNSIIFSFFYPSGLQLLDSIIK